MRRCGLRLLAVTRCEYCNPANEVTFHFSDSRVRSATVCREWIFDNDIALRHASGQKTAGLYDLPQFSQCSVGGTPSIRNVSLADETVLFEFDGAQPSVRLRCRDVVKYLVGKPRLPPYKPLSAVGHMLRIPYTVFTQTKSLDHAQALVRLAQDGIVVVTECPADDATVIHLARSIDREMPTLYDTSFKVVTSPSSGPKNNVAYSAVELDLHQDLAYHESMPGLQLLHCQRFDRDCVGGNSTFLDLCHAADRLKSAHPAAFKTLCEVPAAFMKDDLDRPVPANYYYATPHIHVNDFGDVMKCFWAPAFEAPLPATERMQEYYEARRKFVGIIQELKSTPLFLEFHLQVGDCVIFHQARMLHGRREFVEHSPCSRQLHGAYVNVDSFRNAVVTRGMLHGLSVDELPGFANRSYR